MKKSFDKKNYKILMYMWLIGLFLVTIIMGIVPHSYQYVYSLDSGYDFLSFIWLAMIVVFSIMVGVLFGLRLVEADYFEVNVLVEEK